MYSASGQGGLKNPRGFIHVWNFGGVGRKAGMIRWHVNTRPFFHDGLRGVRLHFGSSWLPERVLKNNKENKLKE